MPHSQRLTNIVSSNLLFSAVAPIGLSIAPSDVGKRLFTRCPCVHSPSTPGIVGSCPGTGLRHLKEEGRKRNHASKLFVQVFSLALRPNMLTTLHMIRLDYLSCILTVLATVLIGKRLWQGWVVAAVNSSTVSLVCIRTAQFGFVPANLLCIALYTANLLNWRPKPKASLEDSRAQADS